ncbi:hypothetical protein Q3W71_18880 [Micromonospora sp. C28SCA-DRY-2]|uniref:hypothetical protein n=1 Tax=Micromonospora sp. C28SCA-DRY-2 TaxID=3059522 RepID=UPI002675141A|nr:hypothetical protein [Micromonospora sp. C28SCA-DRY-2]MDO3703734.1 hypothetical protein [Micromonospora sp. C28SCA-DRY-2]
MDADADDRPPAGVGDRLRTGVLAGLAVAALVAGGAWWRANAPATGPLSTVPAAPAASPAPRSEVVVGDSDRSVTFRVDPVTGAALRLDRQPEPGAVEPFWRYDDDGWLDRPDDLIWRERATVTPQRPVTRQTATEYGARHVLQFRCTGPGELLVSVLGARAGDPLTSGCDGSLVTTQAISRGGPLRVTLSAAGAEPVRVEARLIAVP